MNCKRCGAKLIDGHVYCDHCGAEVQVVPDFNELEEDILPTLVTEEPQPVPGKEEAKRRNRFPELLMNREHVWKIAAAAVIVLVFLGISNYSKSYRYYFHQASVLDQKARFEEAVLYYEEAIQQKETVDAYINLGNDLVLLQRMDKAEDAYRKALALAKSRGEDTLAAYDALLTLFEETGDAEAASVLYDEISKKRLKTNLAAKFVRPPSFSQPGGTYDSDVYLELTSEEDYVIYYTKDGSEPAYNGKEYTKPIRIKGGETMVKACCVDTAGKASMVIQETYTVDYPVPAMPRANPSGGTFHSPIQIVLSKESEGEIYYSWNGSIPTKKSGTRYTGPIWIPEGNNVLSAVVIDDNKMSSDVLRCNYIYLP